MMEISCNIDFHANISQLTSTGHNIEPVNPALLEQQRALSLHQHALQVQGIQGGKARLVVVEVAVDLPSLL